MRKEYIVFCNKLYAYLKNKLTKNIYFHIIDSNNIEYVPVTRGPLYGKKIIFDSDEKIIIKLIEDSYILLDLRNQSVQMKITIIQYLIDNNYEFIIKGKFINIVL